MNLRTSLLAMCLLTIPCSAVIAQTGAVFRQTVENYAEDNAFFEGGESYVTVTKVQGDRMRMDTQGEDGKLANGVIFLGETDEMYMVNHKEKNYLVMDKERVEAMAQQMGEAMKQMEEALAQVPPAQREMMERMMKGKMDSGDYEPPSPPVVTELGESGSVNGVACQWKQVTRDGALSDKACVCDASEIAGGKEMVALAHEMRDFAEGLMQLAKSASNISMFGGGTIGEVGAGTVADLGGFSLISEAYDGEGKLIKRSTFESSDQVTIADTEFTPPSGYKRQEMPMPGR